VVNPSPKTTRVVSVVRLAWARTVLATVIFALLVYYALFHLPFRFPPQVRLWSASYAFGFNNSLAILGLVAFLGVASLIVLLSYRPKALPVTFTSSPTPTARRAMRIAFFGCALVYAGLTCALYLYEVHSAPTITWETRHLLHRTLVMDVYKLRPYAEIAAEYGPVLTYTPLWAYWLLQPLGASALQAYFVCHFILNLSGLWCAYYLFSCARMRSWARVIAFVVIAISGFAPYMGINGVLLRYLLPFASLLIGHRVVTWVLGSPHRQVRWIVAAVTVLLLLNANILVSPEAGLAFALAWTGYAVLSARCDLRVVAVSLISVLVTAVASWFVLPAAYYGTLLHFSAGANNVPLLPAPHLLLYIFTMFLVVPWLAAASLRQSRDADVPGAAIGGALAALCVVMVPGALGRCDPPHVLFYGMGVAMLSMIVLANRWRRAFLIYLGTYAFVSIFLMQLVNFRVFYGIRPRSLLAHPVASIAEALPYTTGTEHPSTATLAALNRYPRLGLPWASFGDPEVERYVISSGKLEPEYYVAIVGVYDAAALNRKLADVGKMEYLLVPTGYVGRSTAGLCSEYLENIRRWFLCPVKLVCRAEPLDPAGSLTSFIADHFVPVERIGSWSVLHRIPHSVDNSGQ
jgi:hypothetical protein